MNISLYILTVKTTEGATVVVDGVTQIVSASTRVSFKLKKGVYSYTVSKTGYYTQTDKFAVYANSTLTVTLKAIPRVETVSLFHCDDSYGTDAKGFATDTSRSLERTYGGKFNFCNYGWVKYNDNQWDSVFLSGSWTVDYWIYPKTVSNFGIDLFLGANTSTRVATIYVKTKDYKLDFYINGGATSNSGYVPVSMNTWHHVAIVYDGEYCSIYVDGQQYYHFEMSISSILGPSNFFGAGWGNQYESNSLRDEIRISKGVRWISNFTPPTSPE